MRQELFLVAIPDEVEAVQAVQACLPDAEVKEDSEASPGSSLRNMRSAKARCSWSRRDRDPQERCSRSKTTLAVQNPTGGDRHQTPRCTIKMYLICMCWLRRVGTAQTGRDPGNPGFPCPSITAGSDSVMHSSGSTPFSALCWNTHCFCNDTYGRRYVHTDKVAKPGSEGVVKEPPSRRRQPPAAVAFDSLLASASAERSARFARRLRSTTSRRPKAPRSAPTSTASSTNQSLRTPADRRRLKARAANRPSPRSTNG